MDIKQIKAIIKDFEKSSLTSLELELDGVKVRLKKGEEVTPPLSEFTNNVKEEQVAIATCSDYEIRSPLVGTLYLTSGPNELPFVKVGDYIEKGQTIAIIEAMKIMNEITAPVAGVIESINLANAAYVGYDQLIMVIG